MSDQWQQNEFDFSQDIKLYLEDREFQLDNISHVTTEFGSFDIEHWTLLKE
jgi:hypothetical protein